jgi:hypothetical protein
MRPMMPLDVQVFEGEVMVATARANGVASAAPDDGAHRLVAGQAVSVMPQTGELLPIAYDAQAYATEASPQARALRQYARAVRDAAPLCYWPLDLAPSQPVGRNVIPDQPDLQTAGAPQAIRDGEHHYLRFQGVPDGLTDLLYTADRLTQLDGATELTVEAWVRPARRHRGIVFNFFDPGQDDDAGFASHVAFLEFVGDPFASELQTERNKMSFWLDALGTTGVPGEAVSNREYPLNQWMHVVAVIRADQLLLFVDGQRVAEHAISARFEVGPALCFAALAEELAEPIPRPGKVTRRLAGDLDQLSVYRYAMTPDVIAEHHRLMRAAVDAEPTP